MSNSSNRRASTKPSGGELPVRTKADLAFMLETEGWSLETAPPRNVGEWNESTDFNAVRGSDENETALVLLGRCLKGERRDWQAMWDFFKKDVT